MRARTPFHETITATTADAGSGKLWQNWGPGWYELAVVSNQADGTVEVLNGADTVVPSCLIPMTPNGTADELASIDPFVFKSTDPNRPTVKITEVTAGTFSYRIRKVAKV